MVLLSTIMYFRWLKFSVRMFRCMEESCRTDDLEAAPRTQGRGWGAQVGLRSAAASNGIRIAGGRDGWRAPAELPLLRESSQCE